MGVPAEHVGALLSLDLSRPDSSQASYAVDIRDSAVVYVNDIETDAAYRRWSPNLQVLAAAISTST